MKKIINILAIAMIVGSTFISNIDTANAYYPCSFTYPGTEGNCEGCGNLSPSECHTNCTSGTYGYTCSDYLSRKGSQTGDVDNDTTSASTCYSFSYNMRKGSRDSNTNNEVSKLQEALVQLGYLNADPTGYFGNATYNAVRAFQSAKGLLSSGFVGTYTRTALYNATCNGNDPGPRPTPNPYPTPTPVPNPSYINLIPSTLPSIVNDKDSGGKTLVGFIIGNGSGYFSDITKNGGDVTITNTNIPNIKSGLGYCDSQTGVTYSYNYYLVACPNASNLLVDLFSSTLNDGQYYYFTVRINQNGTYTDKQYSFTYKKLNTNNNNCTYSYKNGVYGCYYNNDCNYCNGINCYMMCVDNNTNNGGNNNNVCTSGYMNGVYGCYYNVNCNSSYDYNKGYYVNNCNYINGYENFIDKRNYDIPYSSGSYNGTNILY